jgi:carboxypeptidase family protein
MRGSGARVIWIILGALVCGLPAGAQAGQASDVPGVESGQGVAGGTGAAGTDALSGGPRAADPRQQAANQAQMGDAQRLADQEQMPDQQLLGGISGKIVDGTGAVVAGARVRLTRGDKSADVETIAGEDGQFSFAGVAPGAFELNITAAGFAAQTFSGTLRSGENFVVPQIVLAIATAVAEVRVVPTQVEIAEDEIKEQEKQRALGFIPNFYVTYIPNAAPLSPKQKFELAWKSIIDPVSFGITGAIAGIQQSDNDLGGYGQGAQGYAKRYGAAYGDLAIGTFIGGAILPSLLKQDPRYFYKGTGSKRSRVMYALANAVICKGDNGHWQVNYSGLLGSLAAGGISNLYYPAQQRNGAALTFENALIGIGASAAANILQEFVIKKLTPSASGHAPAKVQSMIEKFSGAMVHEGN